MIDELFLKVRRGETPFYRTLRSTARRIQTSTLQFPRFLNKEIVIEDDVNVASGVQFMDTDAHPRDTEDRIADLPPKPEEIKPVRICRRAWIGQDSFVLRGVTVGEGAIVGVNSVLITDLSAYSAVMANPARVAVKNIERPTEA